MLSWVDAASYTERARPGYEALMDEGFELAFIHKSLWHG